MENLLNGTLRQPAAHVRDLRGAGSPTQCAYATHEKTGLRHHLFQSRIRHAHTAGQVATQIRVLPFRRRSGLQMHVIRVFILTRCAAELRSITSRQSPYVF